ncbi:iron chelate uptake ABC transporter family permease subunit [Streptomyces sp. ATCC51928]|uniref:FecCD family ABC transporter permease n=1 Tax=Streptomyces caviscabies TaxID=90079 RepID=A0ABW2MEZ1_9ACTN|nr:MULTISPECIES: iron chelate uptake ABC transporter family permease subunit [unclassified Streptomyces]MCL6288165.1 iron chelate uptake ABC transporter family permease subunit [Streptomyces sp. 43Y-GA-1]MDX3341353.1 iron chelate uptake ABC transporter family permease subunit [Streptomyces sp. ME02-6979.5a]MDX3502163.1 iron chelate uptake ABC transporter family permease subunit [Streptomyces sp. ATCC51928]MDX5522717.1 iron chelate uptake ABC transporter family permease subunit [Streptomyces sp.
MTVTDRTVTDRTTRVRTAPRGYLVIGRTVAIPMRRASVVAGAGLLVLLLAAAVTTLTWGRLGIDLADLPAALLGDAEGKDRFVFNRLRGPRLTVAIGVGAALGLSGALFQSVTRNPLGSPDVIGLSAGAGAGAAFCALMFPGTVPVPVGALIGAILAMALVYVSTGTGFRNPARLVIAGIGVAAMGAAVTQYVVYALERDKASVLTAYVNGSLTARSWTDATTVWLVLLAATLPAALISRRLDIGEMGDDIAEGLGSEPKKAKTLAVLLAIALSAAAVSVSGPIAFIALTAPQIAKRLTRSSSGPHLLLSALTGGLLLVLADLCSQQLALFDDLPVGIYTMAIGGAYLGYLLVREWRKGVL